MRRPFKDNEHVIRMAGLFGVGIISFLLLKLFFVPEGFGKYGFFRAGALDDNRAHALHYASRAPCEECHTDVVEARKASRHAIIGCEACHGPLAQHAEDPGAQTPELPNGRAICLVCHLKNTAKPALFPQVDPVEHAGEDLCTTCHQAHAPDVSS